ncbi:hypothetical protein BCR44DRAFT_61618 [Catenaria anguillulae PL171]|uniref:Uncharacterized protein n=1 Tax=Catenaria anguillulae PL171 TaxID=765915 RepID=A0A1Y2HXS4_9FUNG|nr:hypothetical protein BCR44DRAFT_61618 [Catenaria anguillulae PL171]
MFRSKNTSSTAGQQGRTPSRGMQATVASVPSAPKPTFEDEIHKLSNTDRNSHVSSMTKVVELMEMCSESSPAQLRYPFTQSHSKEDVEFMQKVQEERNAIEAGTMSQPDRTLNGNFNVGFVMVRFPPFRLSLVLTSSPNSVLLGFVPRRDSRIIRQERYGRLDVA